jgi:pilus assembly protein CpaC
MKVAPEVSALDTSAGIRIEGVDVPGLDVRKASTTLDLRDGQSFAIAGLFQQDYQNSVRQLPGVGDVPVLGALFRSARWRRHETELVIIVTPRLTGPVDAVINPMANAKEPGEAALALTGKALDRPMSEPVGGEAPQSISDLLRKL